MMFRSKCVCDRCGNVWTTRKRKSRRSPAHCPHCMSTMTRVLSYWKVK